MVKYYAREFRFTEKAAKKRVKFLRAQAKTNPLYRTRKTTMRKGKGGFSIFRYK